MERSMQISFEMCQDRMWGFKDLYKAHVHKIIQKGLWSHSVDQVENSSATLATAKNNRTVSKELHKNMGRTP